MGQKVLASPSVIPPSSTAEHTQDFVEVVVPITSVGLIPSGKLGMSGKLSPKLDMDARFGTGFCLDAACRFIATNYHVAVSARVHKIKGQRVVQRYLATGPDDKGATANFDGNGVLAFVTKRDLAILELRRPLPHHHGLTLSLDELQVGQEVDIYGYPKGMINPVRKLTRIPAIFKGQTTSGLLAFDYQVPVARIGGASGGIVVDRRTEKIVGVMSETTSATALAVSVQVLADFVSKVQPFVAQKIFPTYQKVPPVLADLYPKFQPPPDLFPGFVPNHTRILERRPAEPYEVTVLREKAQRLANNMANFIAVQSFAWGKGNGEPNAEAEYEVRIIDGNQRFRSYPEGKKELKEPSFPPLNGWAMTSSEWSYLPTLVGTGYRLKVQQAADSIVNGRRMKVFQYRASVEDESCSFRPLTDYGLFYAGRPVTVGCYGEVWTDENTNIIRIPEHLDLSDKLKEYKGWDELQIVVTFGLIKIADEPSRPAPLTIFLQARHGKKIYWCRGNFTDYRLFATRAEIVAK
jgi:hypothetical protein